MKGINYLQTLPLLNVSNVDTAVC